jgi:uncharacterized alpha/beta hydrolase family protein
MFIIFELLSTTYNILFTQKSIQEMGNRQYISIRFIHGQGGKNQSKKIIHDHLDYIGKFQIKIRNHIFNYAIR